MGALSWEPPYLFLFFFFFDMPQSGSMYVERETHREEGARTEGSKQHLSRDSPLCFLFRSFIRMQTEAAPVMCRGAGSTGRGAAWTCGGRMLRKRNPNSGSVTWRWESAGPATPAAASPSATGPVAQGHRSAQGRRSSSGHRTWVSIRSGRFRADGAGLHHAEVVSSG